MPHLVSKIFIKVTKLKVSKHKIIKAGFSATLRDLQLKEKVKEKRKIGTVIGTKKRVNLTLSSPFIPNDN